MRKLFTLLIILSMGQVFAQSDSIVFKQLDELHMKFKALESNQDVLKAKNTKNLQKYIQVSDDFNQYKADTDLKIDSLQAIIAKNSLIIGTNTEELDAKIGIVKDSGDESITVLQEELWQNTLYWIIIIFIVAVFVVIVYVLLKKQISKLDSKLIDKVDKQNTQLENEIRETKKLLGKDLSDARKLLGEDLINTRKVLSEEVLKTRDILGEDLQFSKKSLKDEIKEVNSVLIKDINDTKLAFEEKNAKLDRKLTELRDIQLKMRDTES